RTDEEDARRSGDAHGVRGPVRTHARGACVRARDDLGSGRPARAAARRGAGAGREDRQELAVGDGCDQEGLVARPPTRTHRRVQGGRARPHFDVGSPRPRRRTARVCRKARARMEATGERVMRFSVELPIGVPEDIAPCAEILDGAGVDACFVTDHPAPSRTWLDTGGHVTVDPFVALATAAAVTRTIRVHTHCLIPAYRDPLLTAKAVATLDAVSGGRVILGVAVGYLES